MIRIILVRPGMTEFDEQGRVQGNLCVPLSSEGQDQVRDLVQELAAYTIDAIYTDPCLSALETSEILSTAFELKPKVVELLKNLDYGLWQGMLIDQIKAKQPKIYKMWQEQPGKVCPPNGETVSIVRQRALKAIKKITKKHKAGSTILVVVQGPLASILRWALCSEELHDFWHLNKGQEQFNVIETERELVPVS